MKKINHNKGISLYLAIVVLALMSTALLSLVAVSLGQTRIIASTGDSELAFFVADTGIEKALYHVYKVDGWETSDFGAGNCVFPDACVGSPCPSDLANHWQIVFGDAKYQVCVSDDPVNPLDKVWATGDFNGKKRKIEVNMED